MASNNILSSNDLKSTIQIDGIDYNIHAVTAQIAEDAKKLDGVPANAYAKKTDIPEGQDLSEYAKKSDLFSKNYNDLTNKPTIPTDTNTTYDLYAPTNQTNGNVTIALKANGDDSGTDYVKIQGSGATSVTTDNTGVITISSTGGSDVATIPELIIKTNGTTLATYNANSASPLTADIPVPTVTDDLTSTSTTTALSANQGRVLDKKIAAINTNLGNLGGGDMLKSVYDANNNGAVDTSEKVRVTMNNNVTKDATITIKSGDPDPSDGNIGDIWFKY